MPNILTVQNLSCEKNQQCLFNNINFTLNAGEILQIRGANGSGKTSLLRLLAGLAFFNSGEILWNNTSIPMLKEHYTTQLNYIGHKLGLKEELTAEENLDFYSNRNQIHHALTVLGLLDKRHLLVRQLSAGQKRRAALAKLLLRPTALWILDEPFTAIDQEGIRVLINLMQAHQRQGGMIIFTSHQDISLWGNKKELTL